MSKNEEPRRYKDEQGGDKLADNVPDRLQDEEAKLYYERLEQTGNLIDVNSDTDLASLPPNVTHIRYPDGTIKRVGFA